jgi:hypothetical protein
MMSVLLSMHFKNIRVKKETRKFSFSSVPSWLGKVLQESKRRSRLQSRLPQRKPKLRLPPPRRRQLVNLERSHLRRRNQVKLAANKKKKLKSKEKMRLKRSSLRKQERDTSTCHSLSLITRTEIQ